jgi:hypothetical protein
VHDRTGIDRYEAAGYRRGGHGIVVGLINVRRKLDYRTLHVT